MKGKHLAIRAVERTDLTIREKVDPYRKAPRTPGIDRIHNSPAFPAPVIPNRPWIEIVHVT
jgi:hypothetical protein